VCFVSNLWTCRRGISRTRAERMKISRVDSTQSRCSWDFHECFKHTLYTTMIEWRIRAWLAQLCSQSRSHTRVVLLRRYSDPEPSLLPAIRCARKQTRVEWKFDNNYCSRYQWDRHSPPRCPPRRPSKAAGVKAASVASINFVIRLRHSQIG